MHAVASRFGKDRVVWRYDPILLSAATPWESHAERFDGIAAMAAGATSRRCAG